MAKFIPVDFDPFAGEPPQQSFAGGGPNISVRSNAGRQPEAAPGNADHQPQMIPVDHDPFADAPSVVADVAKAVPSGFAKGVAGLAGLPETLSQMWAAGGDTVLDHMESLLGLPEGWAEETKGYIRQGRQQGAMAGLPSAQQIRQGVETVTGPLYEPKTMPGKFAGTAAEFVPGAGRKLLSLAVAPGVASEAAGQVTEGAPYEPVARAVGAIAGGALGTVAARPQTAQAAIRANMAPQISPDVVERAGRLMSDAEARGIRLTWAEAIEQVAPGSGLPNVQRLIENAPGPQRARMGQFFADRPAQVERAAGDVFDTITPATGHPSGIGRAIGRAAQGTIDDVENAINRHTRPLYQAAERQVIDPQSFQAIKNDPAFRELLAEVRADRFIGPTLQGLPDNSVAVIDAVKKRYDELIPNLKSREAGTARSKYAASILGNSRARMLSEADAATGSSAVQKGSYEAARAQQAELRERFLQPLLDGPLGRLAKKDATTQKAIQVLFPSAPLANSAGEIGTAVSALARRNPGAARDLVRAYVEGAFNQAMRDLQPGANQWGAANFAKNIVGNTQQRHNLEAAIKALGPDGDQVWTGFAKFIEISQAIGKRQHVGAQTSFNTQDLKDLSSGGLIGNASKNLSSPSTLLRAVGDAWSRWQLGGNLDQLATILTDPRSGRMLKAIASEPVNSNKAWVLAGHTVRLYGVTDAKTPHSRNEPNNP